MSDKEDKLGRDGICNDGVSTYPAELREIKAELDKFEQEDSANPSTSPSTHGPAPLSQQHR